MGCCGSKDKYNGDSDVNNRLENYNNATTGKGKQSKQTSALSKSTTNENLNNPTSTFEIVDLSKKTEIIEKLEDYPDDPNNMVNYGVILSLEGKNKEAEEVFQKALQKDPENSKAYQAYAEYYDRTNSPQKALEMYGEGYKHSSPKIALDGDDANLLLNFAINLYKNKDFEKAEKLFKRVVTSSSKNAEACGRYAIFLMKVKKDIEKANTYFKEAAEIEPPNPVWNQRYGEFLQHYIKDQPQAAIYFKRSSLYSNTNSKGGSSSSKR